MGISDCLKCWDTPCSCGWEYKSWHKKGFSEFIADITSYRSKKEAKEILNIAIAIVDKRDE